MRNFGVWSTTQDKIGFESIEDAIGFDRKARKKDLSRFKSFLHQPAPN